MNLGIFMKQKKVAVLTAFVLFCLLPSLHEGCSKNKPEDKPNPNGVTIDRTYDGNTMRQTMRDAHDQNMREMQETKKAIKEKIDVALDLLGKARDAALDVCKEVTAMYGYNWNANHDSNSHEIWECWLRRTSGKYDAWFRTVEDLKKEKLLLREYMNLKGLCDCNCRNFKSPKEKLEALRAGNRAGTLVDGELKLLKAWEKLIPLMTLADDVYHELRQLLKRYHNLERNNKAIVYFYGNNEFAILI
jgi:hypothetical protein